ncbi:MAG: hypothetical protein ABIR08_09065 [Sphingomonas sp.]
MEALRGLGLHWFYGVQLETTRYLIGAIGVAAFTWAAGRWILHRRIQDRHATRYHATFESVVTRGKAA